MTELELAKLENDFREFEVLQRADILNGSRFAREMTREMKDKAHKSFVVYELPDWEKYKEVRLR